MQQKQTIAYRLALIIVLLTLCFGFIIGGLQVLWDYRLRLDHFDDQISNLIKSVEKAAVKAVYTYDSGLAMEVVNGLFEFPPVISVVIEDEHDVPMATLRRYRSELPYPFISNHIFQKKHFYKVALFDHKDPQISIGTLALEASPHDMAAAFYRQSGITLLSTMVQSCIIAFVLFFVFHGSITRPLQFLAREFSKITPGQKKKITLTLPPHLKNTEFEEVTVSGNKMLDFIGSHLEAKDRAEAELKQQKSETERFLHIAEAIILQLDRRGRVLMINQRGLDVLGYQEHELLGYDWFDAVIPANKREKMRMSFSDLLFQNEYDSTAALAASYFENDILTKTGSRRRIYWHNIQETDRTGKVIGILSSGQDITERKAAEDALKATEGSLRAIIEATSEGFAIIDLELMELADINSALHKMLGYSREEMLFSPLSRFVHPSDMDILNAYFKKKDAQPHQSYELRLKRCDAKTVPVEISLSRLPYENGVLPRTVAFISDISKRREQEKRQKILEQQLRQAQKMETIGTLAGGIAHDFNNILTPILGYASLLSARFDKDDPNFDRIEQIAKSAKRGADMIKQILSFSRHSESEMESRYLSPVVRDTLALIKATVPGNVEIQHRINESCPPVLADNTQIQQLILNLCNNAIQAMAPNGGTLTIILESCEVSRDIAETSPTLKTGPHIRLSVSDTGHGMNEKTITRIFDPFYTTKESGKGTGLGLAMVHAIVKEHRGDIFVQSIPGSGSTFTIYLPISSTPVKDITVTETVVTGHQEHVLIVDDEVLNTSFLEELLEEADYSFDSFNNSLEALESFLHNPNKYQIILTDQTMPKMSGDQLVKEIKKHRPDIPVIMMSGYDHTISNENAGEYGVDVFITKPVSIDRLTKAMHDLLQNQK